jgi:hypothetical protein
VTDKGVYAAYALRLSVPLQVVLAQRDTARDRLLEDFGGDRSALPYDLAGLPDVDKRSCSAPSTPHA